MDMQYVPDFEWTLREFTDDDGDHVTRHYLVDPSGQIRADVEEPTRGRLAHIADFYDKDEDRTYWVELGLAKLHCEKVYYGRLAAKPAQNAKARSKK